MDSDAAPLHISRAQGIGHVGLPATRIAAAARAIVDSALVVGSTGNISARVDGGFLITPTRFPYAHMTSEHLVFVDDGASTGGALRVASREAPMHRAIYQARPDVGAVVHTHSVHATAWSFLGDQLLPHTEELAYYNVGPIRCSAPAPAGSPALGDAVVAALGDSRAALIGEHGAVSVGATVDEAVTIAEVLEHAAHVACLVRVVGGPLTTRNARADARGHPDRAGS